MKLYIARHGETTWNVEKRILGSSPGVLTDFGRQQAEALAVYVESLHPDVAIASDLKRVQDTCKPLHERYPQLLLEFTPLLRERNFGQWEGKLRKEVDWQGLFEGSPYEPELSRQIGAESLQDFRVRVATIITEVYDAYATTDKTVLLVTSVGVMNSMHYFVDPEAFTFHEYPNAEATEFDVEAMAKHAKDFLAQ